MKRIALTIMALCLSLAAEDAYHRRLLLPPCDAYGSSTGKLRLVNGGDRPVRLRHVRYSCGCLSGKSPQAAILLGGSAEVEFTLSPNGKGGQLRQKAWLEFEWDRKAATEKNAQGVAAEENALLLTNQVQVEVQVLLLSRLRLGLDVATLDFNDDDAAVSKSVQLTGSAKEAVITDIQRPANSRFLFELSEDGRSLKITAVMDRRSPKRHVMENWTLMTSDEQVPQLALSLNLHVKHDFTVIPDAIEFNSNGKLPLNGCLLVKSVNSRQPVKVLRAVWENADGKIDIRELPHGLMRIAYALEKMPEKGKAAAVRIQTDSKRQEEILVPVIVPF